MAVHPPKEPFLWMTETKRHFVHQIGLFGGWQGRSGERSRFGRWERAWVARRAGAVRGDMPPRARGCLRSGGLCVRGQAGVSGAALAHGGKGTRVQKKRRAEVVGWPEPVPPSAS